MSVTLRQVESSVRRHKAFLAPEWTVHCALQVFDDWNGKCGVVPDPSRGDISMSQDRREAWLRVDPRSHLGSLDELVCHELGHVVCHDYERFVDNSIDSLRREQHDRLAERLAWAIADVYLRAVAKI